MGLGGGLEEKSRKKTGGLSEKGISTRLIGVYNAWAKTTTVKNGSIFLHLHAEINHETRIYYIWNNGEGLGVQNLD